MKKTVLTIFDPFDYPCGMVSAMQLIQRIFKKLGHPIGTLAILTHKPKNEPTGYSNQKVDKVVRYKQDDIVAELNKYDFLYVLGTDLIGSFKVVKDIFDQVHKPFGLCNFDEVDYADEKHIDINRYFLSKPEIKFVHHIEDYSWRLRAEKIMKPTCPEICASVIIDEDKTFNRELLKDKQKKLVYCARIASRKKPLFMAKMSPYIQDYNPEIYGFLDKHSMMAVHTIPTVPEWEHVYKGRYDDDPRESAMYCWNFVWKDRNPMFNPRIEISTYESVLNYCLPLLLTQSLPRKYYDWYPLSYDWDTFKTHKLDYREKAAYLKSKLDEVDKMSIDDKANICEELQKSIIAETDYINRYQSIIQIIESC